MRLDSFEKNENFRAYHIDQKSFLSRTSVIFRKLRKYHLFKIFKKISKSKELYLSYSNQNILYIIFKYLLIIITYTLYNTTFYILYNTIHI